MIGPEAKPAVEVFRQVFECRGLAGTGLIPSGPASDAVSDAAALTGANISGHTSAADWFFPMVFVATAASVISGALAERVRFWWFAVVTLILAGLIYPVVGHWTWGGGWLSHLGFGDLAQSTIVDSVGGWVALTGIAILGPRLGRFTSGSSAIPSRLHRCPT